MYFLYLICLRERPLVSLLRGGSGRNPSHRRHHPRSLPSPLIATRAERRHNPSARRDGGGGASSSLESWERARPRQAAGAPGSTSGQVVLGKGARGGQVKGGRAALQSGGGVDSLEKASREQAWLPRSTARDSRVERRRSRFLGRRADGGDAALPIDAKRAVLGRPVVVRHCCRSFSRLGGVRCWCQGHGRRCPWDRQSAGPQICGAQQPAELQLIGTLVDHDDRDVGACVVGRTVDSCEAVVATARRRCVSQQRSWLA
jgi:hypothetical protein